MEEKKYINAVKFWIKELVIGMQLCPFARRSFEEERIMYRVSDIYEWEMNGREVLDFVYDLDEEEMSNGFMIFPEFRESFMSFQLFYRSVESFLKEKELDQTFQIVSFHPGYQFYDAGRDEISNFMNRSPLPMIHFLRVEEVAAAIASHPNIDGVVRENKIKMSRERVRVIDILKRAGAMIK